MSVDRIEELETEIAELRKRLPPHSVPPKMLWKLEELEEELEKLKEDASSNEAHGSGSAQC
jgi:uncharacterized protein YlxW (UPF0749 family)